MNSLSFFKHFHKKYDLPKESLRSEDNLYINIKFQGNVNYNEANFTEDFYLFWLNINIHRRIFLNKRTFSKHFYEINLL